MERSVHSSQMNRSFGNECALVVVVVVSCEARVPFQEGFSTVSGSPGHQVMATLSFQSGVVFFLLFFCLPSPPSHLWAPGQRSQPSFTTRRLPPLILYSLTSKEHEGCFSTWSRHRRAVQSPLPSPAPLRASVPT